MCLHRDIRQSDSISAIFLSCFLKPGSCSTCIKLKIHWTIEFSVADANDALVASSVITWCIDVPDH